MNEVDRLVTSGTLGDVFIVLCKLSCIHKKNGRDIILDRITSYPKMNEVIDNLIKFFPFVILGDIRVVEKRMEKEAVYKAYINGNYIGPSWGRRMSTFEPDQPKDEMESVCFDPYPNIKVNDFERGICKDKINIGIQVNSGKKDGNFKGFSPDYIKKLVNLPFSKINANILLLGTANYEDFTFKTNNSYTNNIGQTDFQEWISIVQKLDLLITPEGFPAFFAMSQKVSTVVFYTDYQIMARIHPNWRVESILMSSGFKNFPNRVKRILTKIFLKRPPYLNPIKQEQLFSIIYSKFSYLESNFEKHTGADLNKIL